MPEQKNTMLIRTATTNFQVREEGNEPTIEGYFAVFNSDYEMWYDVHESIAPGAFANTLSGDVRALINHETTLVLGRTTAHTLELREDNHGLWGKIKVNPKDSDAMNLYERVKRGDVNQCSFGFDIKSQETEYRDDGTVWRTITEVELYEVSCCTFPAYTETGISARDKVTRDDALKIKLNAWKEHALKKLKGVAE